MREKINYLSLVRITKLSLALYRKLISTGMHIILQSVVLVSKIAQFKSYAAGLYEDDYLMSVEFHDKVISSVDQLRNLLAREGFNLTKWVSNSWAVFKTIPRQV